MWYLECIIILVMVILNGIFAGYEIALASVGVARLDTLVHDKRRGAAAAMRMKVGMEGSLAAVQLGITLVGAIAAATGGASVTELLTPILVQAGWPIATAKILALVALVIPLTVVTILLGELVPKVFSLRNKEWVCLTLSRPMECFAIAVWPAVWFFETTVTAIMNWSERQWHGDDEAAKAGGHAALQELRAIAAVARTSRLIGRREEQMILGAARLASTPVSSAMLPARYISMLSLDSSLSDALIAAHQDMHTRFPVTRTPGDPQEIVGYVTFKDVVSCLRLSPHAASLRAILRPLAEFSPDMLLPACLEHLIREHTHIGLVRDDDHQVVGIITMEDIIEELIGEIGDEYDRLPSLITPVGTGWIVGGNATLSQLREVTQLPFADQTPSVNTFNEWLVRELGRPPHGGDQLELDTVRILIRKIRRHAVQEAHIIQKSKA